VSEEKIREYGVKDMSQLQSCKLTLCTVSSVEAVVEASTSG
jgi:hypothetical protein